MRRIHLLEKIIGNKHWLTTGTYKEKILITFFDSVLPKNLVTKSGFVLFPTNKYFCSDDEAKAFDRLNASDYIISKQIDLIIYDQNWENFRPDVDLSEHKGNVIPESYPHI